MRNPVLFITICTSLLSATAVAQTTGTCEPAVAEAFLDVNNVRAKILNNGGLFRGEGPAVYEVPKGGGVNAVFASTIWIAGTVNGQVRASATLWNSFEMWPGPLDDDGNPPADCSNFDRLYEVSRLDILAYEENGSLTADLLGWPTGLGAPTYDANGNLIELLDQPLLSRIDRVIDLEAGERPAILGDQSIWWVMNDVGNIHETTDSPPIGLEVHAMAYAFIANDDINNTTFYKYTLHYKGSQPLLESYFTVWADPDLGEFTDDYIGSDSLLGLGYVYNGDNNDDVGLGGYGTPPPALGYDFMQGPIVPSPGDTAVVSGISVPDHLNLGMASFSTWFGTDGTQGRPREGIHYYNYARGRWKFGERYTVGGSGLGFSEIPTNYMFSGDPVVGGYWSEINPRNGEGPPFTPADRRFLISTGPFNMQPGDEQEIVFAIVWAKGEDHLDSVRALREADTVVQDAFDAVLEWPYVPVGVENEQPHPQGLGGIVVENPYPNPSARDVRISVSTDAPSHVWVEVYSSLGRELMTVVSETFLPGTRLVEWSMLGYAAGTYFVVVSDEQSTQSFPITIIR